ncbi:DUF1656 domain-containing protein [Beijerinckia sp. L45]|uniref:DUF1656 domain-containing protein n=1 Tax=Beijerinckia sp. L45 TaxID=1641855 RepID=UPI00131AF22C|nr:DUF1656 domain-containing protein [Beijerinckia sp. L45]
MTHGFHELVVGGVLFAPFVTYAIGAAVIFLLARPALRMASLEKIFANPPLVEVCLYIAILAILFLIF